MNTIKIAQIVYALGAMVWMTIAAIDMLQHKPQTDITYDLVWVIFCRVGYIDCKPLGCKVKD